MSIRCLRSAIVASLLLACGQVASAQTVFSPTNINPYARNVVSPYTLQRGDLYDFRNPLIRPAMPFFEFGSSYELGRLGRPDYGYPPLSVQEWIKQRESETQFSPSGQPIGFMIFSPYYDLPNLNSFIPSAPNRGRGYR